MKGDSTRRNTHILLAVGFLTVAFSTYARQPAQNAPAAPPAVKPAPLFFRETFKARDHVSRVTNGRKCGEREWGSKVDLSKVDEIGFTDLSRGAGHGQGGNSGIDWMEVYGNPVKRSTS